MKGLFEWKLLAAILAVLIVASSALVSNMGIKDAFLNSTGGMGDLLKSPFGSFFDTPEKAKSSIMLRIYTDEMTLELDSPVNISSESSDMNNFRGGMLIDFEQNRTRLSPEGTEFRVQTTLDGLDMEGLVLPSLVLEDVSYVVTSRNTNITAEGEKIEIYDFTGSARISDSLVLEGNVSRVKNGDWSIG